MKKFNFPIRLPEGCKPYITQGFANTGNNEWYKANGITAPFHNGTDIVLVKDGYGDNQVTYGAECITPSDGWHIVKKTYESPLSTKGNGVTIESEAYTDDDGELYVVQAVFWHLSSVEDNLVGRLPEKTTFGYLGNSGLVRPAPSPYCPFCGSHLHLMAFKFKWDSSLGRYVLLNADNGVNGAIDAMTVFDIEKLVGGGDADKIKVLSKDLLPFPELLQGIADSIARLFNSKNK